MTSFLWRSGSDGWGGIEQQDREGNTVKEERPEICTDEMLAFLDDIRESGHINMYGAGEELELEFGLDKRDARSVLGYWMKTFGRYHR